MPQTRPQEGVQVQNGIQNILATGLETVKYSQLSINRERLIWVWHNREKIWKQNFVC